MTLHLKREHRLLLDASAAVAAIARWVEHENRQAITSASAGDGYHTDGVGPDAFRANADTRVGVDGDPAAHRPLRRGVAP